MADVEWKYAEAHMWDGHHVATQHADEALDDLDAVWFDPDPASRSGVSARVIGYSHSLDAVLTVIVIHTIAVADDVDTSAAWVGSNGWRASTKEQRIYREAQA